jgi:hypothetical protein
MTCTIVPSPAVETIFRKLGKKDPARFGQLVRKLRELGEN